MNSNTQITAAQFAHQYPALFALYQRLMSLTIVRINSEKAALTRKFDEQVEGVLQAHAAAELAARKEYDAINGPAILLMHASERRSTDTLNETLRTLLEGKERALAVVGSGQLNEELARLSLELASGQACYRELGLHEEASRLAVQYEQDKAALLSRYSALRQAGEAVYQREVQAAFALHNDNLRQAQRLHRDTVDQPALELKRQCRAAESEKHEKLTAIAWERDEATTQLHAWTAVFKEVRMQCINSFLKDPCVVTLQQELEDAIREIQI